jgi:hypothetical protein
MNEFASGSEPGRESTYDWEGLPHRPPQPSQVVLIAMPSPRDGGMLLCDTKRGEWPSHAGTFLPGTWCDPDVRRTVGDGFFEEEYKDKFRWMEWLPGNPTPLSNHRQAPSRLTTRTTGGWGTGPGNRALYRASLLKLISFMLQQGVSTNLSVKTPIWSQPLFAGMWSRSISCFNERMSYTENRTMTRNLQGQDKCGRDTRVASSRSQMTLTAPSYKDHCTSLGSKFERHKKRREPMNGLQGSSRM